MLPAPELEDTRKAQRIHRTVRVFLRRGLIPREAIPGYRGGAGSYLAKHFGVTRQRISQVVRDERLALDKHVTE